MGLFSTGGSFPAGLTPQPTKTLFANNYLTFDQMYMKRKLSAMEIAL